MFNKDSTQAQFSFMFKKMHIFLEIYYYTKLQNLAWTGSHLWNLYGHHVGIINDRKL